MFFSPYVKSPIRLSIEDATTEMKCQEDKHLAFLFVAVLYINIEHGHRFLIRKKKGKEKNNKSGCNDCQKGTIF